MSLRSRARTVVFHPCVLVALLTSLVVPGCYDESRATVDCGDKVCPDGWLCYKSTQDAGADPYQCLRCGNGTVDSPELCDDGKETATCNLDFAHANAPTNCTKTKCGDGYINRVAGETCDDGNTTNADGCSSECHSELCGNGVRDAHEDCDDGVLDSLGRPQPRDTEKCDRDCTLAKCGDGYLNKATKEACDVRTETETCNLDLNNPELPTNCTVTKCGDGYINKVVGETCDDGNTENGDGCSSLCHSELCGNGVKDAHEDCDDGSLNDAGLLHPQDTEKCNRDCTFARCGDGYVNPATKETCDGATESETCNLDLNQPKLQTNCTVTKCGDGYINRAAGETCDDGNTENGDGCSAQCRWENCGNGVKDATEQCDDGKLDVAGNLQQQDSAKCNRDCTFATCGDGYLNKAAKESCDDGRQTATCNMDLNRPDLQTNCTVATCGDGYANKTAGETCDDGNTINGDGCSAQCLWESCGNGVRDTGEDCDDGALDSTGTPQPRDTPTCNSNCTVPKCGDGYLNKGAGELCDDGIETHNCNFTADRPSLKTNCAIAKCGDGYTNKASGETCDDGKLDAQGNATDTDSCDSNCTAPQCGDGHLNRAAGEACDDGEETEFCNLAPDPGLKTNCTAAKCGDGYVNRQALEACDDANTTDGDGCSSRCTLERCGNSVLDSGEECDDGNAVFTDFCVNDCRIQRCGDGSVFAGKQHLYIDLATGTPVAGGEGNGKPDAGMSADGGAEPSGLWVSVEQCDSKGVNTPDCNANCTKPICGDRIVNAEVVYTDATGATRTGEQCDEWSSPTARVDTPTCNSDCTVPRCGDKRLNTATEQCDYSINDGGKNNLGSCTFLCATSVCGDGYVNKYASPPEECDEWSSPAARADTPTCNSDCTVPHCGDGRLNTGAGEQCDYSINDSGKNNPANCTFLCATSECGDGYVNKYTTPPEECDEWSSPAVRADTPTCNSDCTVPRCGDKRVNTETEQCDYSINDSGKNNLANCTFLCATSRCGDGYVNKYATPPEECDEWSSPAVRADTPSCNSDCTVPHCGDGYTNVRAGEQCDVWSTTAPSDTTKCNHDCTVAQCGDGYINKAAGEDCDPPDSTEDAGTARCDADCHN